MKVILVSAVAILVLGYGAAFLLSRGQEPAYKAFIGSGTRVGDPGHNLVGPQWNGMGEAAKKNG